MELGIARIGRFGSGVVESEAKWLRVVQRSRRLLRLVFFDVFCRGRLLVEGYPMGDGGANHLPLVTRSRGWRLLKWLLTGAAGEDSYLRMRRELGMLGGLSLSCAWSWTSSCAWSRARSRAGSRAWVRVSAGPVLSLMLIAATCLALTGCLGSLHKDSVALAAATAPVVDQAAKAYAEANTVHDAREDFDATLLFDSAAEKARGGAGKAYNPRTVEPLLSEKAIDIRLTVLKALQEYVTKLVAITAGTSSKELNGAAASLGSGLTASVNGLIPGGLTPVTTVVVENGAATTTTAPAAGAALTTGEQNAISTAANALGQFLIYEKVKKNLPGEIVKMDPAVQKLCMLLESDVDALKEREKIDFNFMIDQQTQFLLDKPSEDAGMRRELIMGLPRIARQHKAADEQLDLLRAAVEKLAKTHAALAEVAKGNDPESLKDKLGELAAAGANLGKFYSSLPGS